MSDQTAPKASDVLEKLNKLCPKCLGEGHGGDGCEYCWTHDPAKDAIDQASHQLYEDVVSLIPTSGCSLDYIAELRTKLAIYFNERTES